MAELPIEIKGITSWADPSHPKFYSAHGPVQGTITREVVEKTKLYVQHSPSSSQRYWVKSNSVYPSAVAVVIASAGDLIDPSKFNVPAAAPFNPLPWPLSAFPWLKRHGGDVPTAWIVPPVCTQITCLLPIVCVQLTRNRSSHLRGLVLCCEKCVVAYVVGCCWPESVVKSEDWLSAEAKLVRGNPLNVANITAMPRSDVLVNPFIKGQDPFAPLDLHEEEGEDTSQHYPMGLREAMEYFLVRGHTQIACV